MQAEQLIPVDLVTSVRHYAQFDQGEWKLPLRVHEAPRVIREPVARTLPHSQVLAVLQEVSVRTKAYCNTSYRQPRLKPYCAKTADYFG